MIEFNFTNAKWIIDSEGIWLWLNAPRSHRNQIQEFIVGLNDKTYTCTIKRRRKKRSLDANAYCWALINEMANGLRASKEEIYLNMLKRYGQSSVVSVVEEAAETFKKSVKYCEEIGQATLNGKEFTHIRVFSGSSTYDSREMAILIDGIVSECKELGIETMTLNELERLKGEWKNG